MSNLDNKKAIPYTHEEFLGLLDKLVQGFMLDKDVSEFKADLEEMIRVEKEALQAEIDADVQAEASIARAAEEALKKAIGVDAAEGQDASGVFVQINEAKAMAEQAQAEVDALELVVGVEGVEASGLFKMIADMKDEVFVKIDADVKALEEVIGDEAVEANEELGTEAVAASGLFKLIEDTEVKVKNEIKKEVTAIQNDIDVLEEVVGAKAADEVAASGVFKAIEDAEARISADMLGKIGAGDNQVIAKITEAKTALQQEIDADVKVEADRAKAAELALKDEIDADVQVETNRATVREAELQAALDGANNKITALEAKNAELEAALDLKATNLNLQQLAADVATIKTWQTEIIREFDIVKGRVEAVEKLEDRITALENK